MSATNPSTPNKRGQSPFICPPKNSALTPLMYLFDLDGTLVDSVADLAAAANVMLAGLGRASFAEDCYRLWIGNGARVMVQRALSGSHTIDEHLDEALVSQATKAFFAAYEQAVCVRTCLYAGVKETLQALKASGSTLVIITNKPVQFVPPILEALEINGYFDLVLGGDSLPWKKPDPRPLLHVCEALNVDVAQCVMVGDSKNDIEAAQAAQMTSVAVTYGYHGDVNVADLNASYTISDFADLRSLFI